MSSSIENALAVVTVVAEVAFILMGTFFCRNHREAIERLKAEEGVDITTRDFRRHNLRDSPYGLVIGLAVIFLMMVSLPLVAAFTGVIDSGEPMSDGDVLFTYLGFLFFGAVLPWAAFIEMSLPRSFVSERGVWNITGLGRPFLIRWDEIDAVLPSKYPTRVNWFVIRGPQGVTRINSRNGVAYLASQLSTKVPEQKWRKSAGSMGISTVLEGHLGGGVSEPGITPRTREEAYVMAEIARKAEASVMGVGLAAVFILLSSGVMLWAVFDIAFDPSYGGLVTQEDWLSWLACTSTNLSALAVLVVAWRRFEARLLIFAAMLSGFSFLGPVMILGQVLIWRGYRKGVLPWHKNS